MWYQKYGCVKHYRCSIAYYMMSFLSKSYQNFLDRSVDTSGQGKDLVNGFNNDHKLYLATCLIMHRTPEADKIDINCMRDDSMIQKGEVSFGEECQHLLDIRDGIGTKGDKKHAKREAKAHLKQKYYWIHKEEDIIFNGMKGV